MFRRILVAYHGSPESGLRYDTDSVPLNPLRRAHRVRDRARKVRLVDRDGCGSDPIVESRGTSATRSIHSQKHDHNVSAAANARI